MGLLALCPSPIARWEWGGEGQVCPVKVIGVIGSAWNQGYLALYRFSLALPGTESASSSWLTLACFPAPGSWGPHILAEGKAAHIYIPGWAREQVKG